MDQHPLARRLVAFDCYFDYRFAKNFPFVANYNSGYYIYIYASSKARLKCGIQI